uniref:Long-chain fatty acid--CoA ligase n=1 Tax=Heligmosomoides polygyrus TaxID=6339 RepID=A0A183FLW2_HELPZ
LAKDVPFGVLLTGKAERACEDRLQRRQSGRPHCQGGESLMQVWPSLENGEAVVLPHFV